MLRLKADALFWALACFLAAFIGLGSPAARAATVLTPAISLPLSSGSSNRAFGVAITPDGKFAYVTDDLNAGNSFSVIDTATNTVVGSPIPLPFTGAAPFHVAFTPDGKFAYVTAIAPNIGLNATAMVFVIDTQAAQNPATQASAVVDTITLSTALAVSGAADYEGIAINGSFAYVADTQTNTVVVIDTGSNTIVGSPIPVSSGATNIAITPDGKSAYVTGNSGVSVIDTQKAQNPATQASALVNTITFSGPTFSSATTGIAFTPDGKFAYVAQFNGGTVSVINTATGAVVGSPIVADTVVGPAGPMGIAISPDGKSAYVTTWLDKTVAVIDTQKAQTPATQASAVVNTLTVGLQAGGIAITPDGQFAYVANWGDATVSVIALATLSSLPDGTLNTAYSSTLTVSDAAAGASTFAVTTGSLPPGLSLDAATGKITGTPTATGSYSFTVTASGTVRGLTQVLPQDYTVTINAVTITTGAAPIPTLGETALALLALLLGASAVAVKRRGR